MFAALFLEREPLSYRDLPSMVLSWVEVVGGLSAVALLIWLVAAWPRMRKADRDRIPSWQQGEFLVWVILAALSYAVYGAVRMPELTHTFGGRSGAYQASRGLQAAQQWSLAVAGFFALCAVCEAFVANRLVMRLRGLCIFLAAICYGLFAGAQVAEWWRPKEGAELPSATLQTLQKWSWPV